MNQQHPNHDQLFKELLHNFLPEFLLLVAPRQAQHLKLEHGRFLDQEVFTDFPTGDHRRVDVLYRTRTLEDQPKIVLVHVEVESEYRHSFDERMALYGMALYLRYREPIFPIALFLKGGGAQGSAREEAPEIHPRVVEVGIPDFWVHRFRYLSFSLSRASAEEYLARKDPLAAALAALMRFREGTMVEHKLRCLKTIAGGRLNAARSFQLAHLVDKYLPLQDNERKRFEEQVAGEENKEVEDMNMAWAEKLYTDGRESGRKEGEEVGLRRGEKIGLQEGTRRTLLRLLRLRFGDLPQEAMKCIAGCDELDQLERWSEAVLTAPDLAAMGLPQ